MGFFSNLVSATVKTVLTPVAVIKDAADVATGQEPTATKELIEGAVKDAQKATDNLCDGEL